MGLDAEAFKVFECVVAHDALLIDEDDFTDVGVCGLEHVEKQGAIACAEISNARNVHREVFADEGRVPHEHVEAGEIAAGVRGGFVHRGQLIENLRLDHAHHSQSTFRNAPWQLKPAPKEHIHHSPPGALPRSARSRTWNTKGLLILPSSRSASALQRVSCSVRLNSCRNAVMHVATARVKNPGADVLVFDGGFFGHRFEQRGGVLRCKRGHWRRQDVAEQAAFGFKAEEVARGRVEERLGGEPLDAAA